MLIAMEVIEELQGPVIIITPPQEHFRRPHNTDNSVYLHLALWGNGELYKSKEHAETSFKHFYMFTLHFNILEYSFLSDSQFCLLVNVKMGVKQFK